jgi:hypothetical protein
MARSRRGGAANRARAASCAGLFALLGLAGCAGLHDASNPLIGRWSVAASSAAFNLGTAEFRAGRMRAFGLDQEVDYLVEGDAVRVVPRGFGPQLEATMLGPDTARIGSPLTGGLLTLRRLD